VCDIFYATNLLVFRAAVLIPFATRRVELDQSEGHSRRSWWRSCSSFFVQMAGRGDGKGVGGVESKGGRRQRRIYNFLNSSKFRVVEQKNQPPKI